MSKEDIKILEEKIKALNLHILNYEKSDCKTSFYETLLLERNALVNILKERLADEERIKELKEQVEMLDKAYSGAIKESKKYFEIVKDSIPKAKVIERIKQLNKGIEEFKKYVADSTGEEKQFYKKYLGQFINTRNELQELLKCGGE